MGDDFPQTLKGAAAEVQGAPCAPLTLDEAGSGAPFWKLVY